MGVAHQTKLHTPTHTHTPLRPNTEQQFMQTAVREVIKTAISSNLESYNLRVQMDGWG